MPRRYTLVTLVLITALLSIWATIGCAQLPAPVHVTLDPTVRYQTMQGFGTCTYLYGEEMTKIYPTTQFQDMYMKDLGCTMMRMEIQPEMLATPDDDMEHLNVEKLDWKNNGINVNGHLAQALAARKSDEFKVFASIWSPPGWMKDTHVTGNGGHVLPKYRAAFGKYLAAICRGFEDKFGIPIYAISLQNELTFSEF